MTQGGAILTGSDINLFAMKVAIQAISLEIKTGMRGRMKPQMTFENNWKAVTGQEIKLSRMKSTALDQMNNLYKSLMEAN